MLLTKIMINLVNKQNDLALSCKWNEPFFKFLEFDPSRIFHESSSTIFITCIVNEFVFFSIKQNQHWNFPWDSLYHADGICKIVFEEETALNLISKEQFSSQKYEGNL